VGLVGFFKTRATYNVDENRMAVRSWNGNTRQLAWQDLAHVDAPQGGSITLTDSRGSRISLPPRDYGYRNRAGQSLYEAVETQIARLPNEIKAQMENPRIYRFGADKAAMAGGFMALLCVTAAITFPFLPYSGPPAPPVYFVGISGFFLFGAVFMAYLALRQATRLFMLTDSALIERSLFGMHEIPFDQANSLTTK